MATHRSIEEWSRILAAYEDRDGTQAQFCEDHRISLSALNYHLNKRKADDDARGAGPLIELPPSGKIASSALAAGPTARIAELSFRHARLGAVSVRCQVDDLCVVMSQLSHQS